MAVLASSHCQRAASALPAPCRPSHTSHPAASCPSRVTGSVASRRAAARRPRRAAAAAAAGGSSAEDPAESAEAAFDAAQSCMLLFCGRWEARDLDAVVEYLPEAVIDRLLVRKKAKREAAAAAAAAAAEQGQQAQQDDLQQRQQGQRQQQQEADDTDESELSFQELVALAQPDDLALDAFSARGLLNAAPRSAAVLSSLKLAPNRFMQRYEVTAQSGEEMVLIFDMHLEESLQPKYRGLQVVKKWFLKGITGEPACPGDVPSKPEPCWGPEAVVQAQLEALAIGDVAGVFRFASPHNQEATGPVERFGAMLQSGAYRLLVGHLAAEVLRTVQMQADVALVIVGVRSNVPTSEPGVTQRGVFSWTVRLQEAGAVTPGGEAVDDCWMTESVQPVSQSLFM